MDCLYLRKKALFLDVFVVFILHMNTDTQGEFMSKIKSTIDAVIFTDFCMGS